MGNSIDAIKIKNNLNQLGIKIYSKQEKDTLKFTLQNIIDLIGVDFIQNENTVKILIDIICVFSADSLINLIENIRQYILISDNDVAYIIFGLDLIKLAFNAMAKKFKTFREIFIYSINLHSNIRAAEICQIFPLNVLLLCLDLICRDEFEKSK